MLGRGFGRLMSRVEKPEELLDTLEKTMVRGADAIRSAVDDPKGAADAVARHSKAMADAFKEGYAETTCDCPQGETDASARAAARDETEGDGATPAASGKPDDGSKSDAR